METSSEKKVPPKNLKESLKLFEKSCKSLKSNQSNIINEYPQLIVTFIEILEDIKENNYNDSKILQIALEYHFSLINFVEFYKNNKIVEPQLIKFIMNKTETLSKVYYDLLNLNPEEIHEFEKFNLLLFEFLKSNYELTGKSYELEDLFNQTILSKELILQKDFCLTLFNFFIKLKKQNNSFLLLEYIDKSIKEDSLNSVLTSNIFTFIFSLPTINEITTLIKENELINFKTKIQSILIKFININLGNFKNDKELLKLTLKKINSRIFSLCSKPEVFSDFLMNIFKNDNDLEIRILALSCLFTLISKHDFIFQNYFKSLYEILFIKGITNLSSQTIDKLLKILHLSLTSGTISFTTLASFIKKLARLCLAGTSIFVCKILKFIQLIIVSNKKLNFLLNKDKSVKRTFIIFNHERMNIEIMNNSFPKDMRTGEIQLPKNNDNINSNKDHLKIGSGINYEDKEDKSLDLELNLNESLEVNMPRNDLFNDEERDPDKTNSLKSGLWEIYSLLNHYNTKVSLAANKFCKYLNKNDIYFENVLEVTQDKLIHNLENKTFRFYPLDSLSYTKSFVENVI